MDFRLTPEDQDLQGVVREFLADRSPEDAVRAASSTSSHDADLWTDMSQLELQGIAVPVEYGGAGFGFVQVGIVLEELGRALAVSPYLSTCVMASELLLGLDNAEACEQYLPRIASGDLVATVAMAEDSGSWRPEKVTTVARRDGGEWFLDGHKSFVLDGLSAELILVVARIHDVADDAEALGVFAVDASAIGLGRCALLSLDQTRKQARITLDNVAASMLGSARTSLSAIERMLDHTAIAISADCVGGIARTLEMSVHYAKERFQFGRPIGSFQAIKHKCATVLVDLEAARSAALYATWAASTLHPDARHVAPMTKALCADAYVHAALENIQIHGGIGFTWEHPAHLYLKRAKSNQALLGGSDLHRRLMALRLGW